jgi:hypothetical protein
MDLEKILHPPFLNPVHVEDLAASGISPEAALAAGTSSVPPNFVAKILALCGWPNMKSVESILAFCYSPLDGGPPYYRFRVYPEIKTRDGRVAKYLQGKGSCNRVYLPPGVDPQGKDSLYISEGEKKSYCLTLNGFACIGLGGVYGWRTKNRDGSSSVIPDFDAINWNKRDVIVVFDADIAVNDQVARAEAELAEELTRRKARVFTIRLPYGPGCAKGVDDFLMRHGKEAFNKLSRKPVKAKAGHRPQTERPRSCPYSIVHGAISHEKQTRDGPIVTPLCNFNAAIVVEEVRDDGLERQVCFALEGRLADGRPLPRVEIPAREFGGMSWVTSTWGSKAIINAGFGAKDHLRAAIQFLSGEVPTRTVFTHSGWREIDGAWLFLHGGGAIGARGPVNGISVAFERRLGALVLPPPPTGEDLKSAVQASWNLLKLAPLTITAPLLAATYRAPLEECVPVDLSLFLSGQTGGQKTELTALAQVHFGAGFNRLNLPDSWASTANALEKLAFLGKDAILTIDDFCPRGGQAEVSRLHAAADRVFRGAANRAGRGRMAPDGGLKLPYLPRAFVISSGEDIPTGHSLRARLVIVEVKRGDVDLPLLTRAQADAAQGLYAQAMAAFIRWLAPQMDKLKATLPQRARELREEIRRESWDHDKIPDNLASLLLGLETYWMFATEVGALSQEEDGELYARAWGALLDTARAQAGHQEAEEPTGRFLSLLAAALVSGRAHVANARTGGRPEDAESWGWRGTEPQGGLVGWVDEANLLLEPDAAFAMAQRLAREQGGCLAITPRTLWRRMADRGLLASREAGRNLQYFTIYGRRRRVLHLLVDDFRQQENS